MHGHKSSLYMKVHKARALIQQFAPSTRGLGVVLALIRASLCVA